MTTSTTIRLAVAVAAAATTIAHADITIHTYTNSSNYHYRVTHMPDLDQRRDDCCVGGLPNNGAMYCVPTATFNLFAYVANHGFPFVSPGQANWQSDTNYVEATDWILDLGARMDTDPIDGTGGAWIAGTQDFVATDAPLMSASFYWRTDTYTPRASKMAKLGAKGAVIAFAYGRYSIVGTYLGFPLLMRTGGHAVTLNESKSSPSSTTLRYRDPADVPTNTDQDPFVTKEVTVTSMDVAFSASPFDIRNVTLIDYKPGDTTLRILDTFMTLKPMFGLSFANTGGTNWSLTTIAPLALDGLGGGSINLNAAGQIFGVADLQSDADGDDALALVNIAAGAPLSQLRRIDVNTGAQTTLGSFNTLKRFTVGRDGRIYAHDGSKLYCLLPDGTLEAATSNIPVPTSLAYDDAKDEIIVYSVLEKRIARLSKTLQPVDTWLLPANYLVTGDGSVTVNPFDGSVWFDSDATDLLYRAMPVADRMAATFSSFAVPGIVDPKGLSAGDDGTLYVSTPTGLKAVKQGASGGFAIDTTNPFHNQPVAGRISMRSSRTNFDPAQHTGPGWVNIDPADLEPIGVVVQDCVSDLDGDNDTDAADLARLLANWGTTGGIADIDQSGLVDSADLSLLLGGWGPCD